MENTIKFINSASADQLRILNEHIKLRWSALKTIACNAISVNDTVTCTDKNGRTLTGTVVKINRKTVHVRSHSDSMVWTVPGSMLTKV